MKQSLIDRLVEVLQESHLVSDDRINEVLRLQKEKGGSFGNILIEKGYITQKNLLMLVSQQLSIPPIDLSKYKVDPEVVKLIPEKTAREYKLFPIATIGNKITVAMADPTNIIAIDDIKTLTGRDVDLVLSSLADIENVITQHYKLDMDSDFNKIMSEADPDSASQVEVVEEDDNIDVGEINAASKKAPIVKLVSMILNEALANRASDIHIEPQEGSVRVRYRVDGQLREALSIPRRNQNAIIARIKIMSNLDITETRAPQDGRFRIEFRGREIDFRVSVLPITFGNKIVMRALDKSSLSMGLDKLGFLPDTHASFNRAISRPYGMILITGPTGSGKSTTLYSILNQLNTRERNIVTIEDPVEYQVPGITQIQVNADIGLTFSNGLKSILRQTPDIVMVGEIRDGETADIAIKAALTGQLVLSTLHTNDAPSALTRLVDMGIEPFLIASSVIMTAAQRLCRKICPHCKEKYDIADSALEKAGIRFSASNKKPEAFYRGKGCAKCNQSGYLGRIALLETFTVNNTIREMIVQKKSADHIKRYAVEQGMKTLRDNGMTHFLNGVTTLEEILRVTSEE
ncbi:MAG: GspE/PulE family protein [Candidatus Omnitrophica bacterium]|nr:GspE/PulE family protein [Candidatus Omnitrophota bacterium]